MHLLKRTILITGASSGIGRASAEHLLAQGHTVIGLSRDCSRFEDMGENFYPVQLDLSQLEGLPEKIRRLEQQFPDLNAAIFSAGIGRFGSLEEFSYSQIQALMNINFISPTFLTRALLPSFKRKNRSDLIYIGSEAALKGSRKGSIYCASKFALRGFTQALREECSNDCVRVCLINPGMVRTAFFDSLSFEPGSDAKNFLLPEDVAEAVSYVINARKDMVIDELNLNPASKVVRKK
ncbi:MAG: SDR family oxidoreductase [Methylococcaceae bacterium]|nr:SDR family oxidoreductase [Methylococcaceae bacterium]